MAYDCVSCADNLFPDSGYLESVKENQMKGVEQMNKSDYEKKVKKGDTVRIVPIDSVPNAERVFKVDELLNQGFLYGCSITCDGYVIPYSWIKSIRVIKKGAEK